jgi:hypothetical protein
MLMKEEIFFSKEHPEFLTVTCLEWKHILAEDRFKDIIIDSLMYLSPLLVLRVGFLPRLTNKQAEPSQLVISLNLC